MTRSTRTAGLAGAALLTLLACQELPMSQAAEIPAVDGVHPDSTVAEAGMAAGAGSGVTTVCDAYTQVLEQLRAAAAAGSDPAHAAAFEVLVRDACS